MIVSVPYENNEAETNMGPVPFIEVNFEKRRRYSRSLCICLQHHALRT